VDARGEGGVRGHDPGADAQAAHDGRGGGDPSHEGGGRALIIDASVATKWFVDEEAFVEARDLLSHGPPLEAPDLIVVETANVLWRYVRREVIPPAEAAAAAGRLSRYFVRLHPPDGLAHRAVEIAVSLGHPAYDCFYLALAERRRLQLVTADMRLLTRIAGGSFASLARPLVVQP
jgi:predicted nucleic acid-binding protein